MKETIYGIDKEEAEAKITKTLDSIMNNEDETFRMKFLIALPYFLPQTLFGGSFVGEAPLFKTADIINFEDLAIKLRINFNELKLYMRAVNLIISQAEYKQMKNKIYERLDLPTLEISEVDQKEFFVTPYFIDELAKYNEYNYFDTQIDESLLLYDIINGNFRFGKEKFLEFHNKVKSYNYNELVEGIICEFFIQRIEKKDQIIEELDYSKTTIEIMELTIKTTYEFIIKDLKLIELNIQYRFNWVILFGMIYRRVRNKQKRYQNEIEKERMKQAYKKSKLDQGITAEAKQIKQIERAKYLMDSIKQKPKKESWGEMEVRIQREINFETETFSKYVNLLIKKVMEIRGIK